MSRTVSRTDHVDFGPAGGPISSCLVLIAACALVAGFPPPHVNEAHYLCKARHHADPRFAPGDLFLDSGNAHALFASVFGRLARIVPLPLLAYGGRITGWFLLSISWIALFRSVGFRGWTMAAAGLGLIWLTFATPMAGEWVVGGVEAKVFAFGFGTLAMSRVAAGRWRSAILYSAAATAWHPLVGGWLGLLITGSAVLCQRPDEWFRTTTWVTLLAAAGLAAVGVWPALQLTWGQDPSVLRQAAHIYVDIRLGHHLVLQRLDPLAVVRHSVAWLVFAVLWWRYAPWDARLQRVGLVVWGSALLLATGIALSAWHAASGGGAAKWLRFYWFRTSDWLLPIGLAVVVWRGLTSHGGAKNGRRKWLLVLAAGVPVIDIVGGAATSRVAWNYPPAMRQSRLLSGRRVAWDQVAHDWRETCRWIDRHTEPDAVFLTPRYQETFKWYAHRAEVVNWKDVPQDARRLVEWWRRYQAVYPAEFPRRALADHPPATLRQLAARYGARYAVIDTRRSPEGLPWKRIYPVPGSPSVFWVYRLPLRSVDQPPRPADNKRP